MSKYGWGWIWKSWFSPIGLLFRAFGYKPQEDIKVDLDEVLWWMTIVPIAGYSAKELVAHGSAIFSGMFDKNEVAEAVREYTEDVRDGKTSSYDRAKAYSFSFTKEDREIILERVKKNKSWHVLYDEYKSVSDDAESQANWHKRRGREKEVLSQILLASQEKEGVTKESIIEEHSEKKRQAADLGWDCCKAPLYAVDSDGDDYCENCLDTHY